MPKKPFRLVVLASTRGTDFGAMLAEHSAGKLKNIDFVGLISNKTGCDAVERAQAANVPIFIIENTDPDFHQKILETVQKLEPDLICLVGWMKILKPEFCEAFPNKILNVHPSLLPKFAGKMDGSVHTDVLKAGEKKSGMTIHLATADIDAGAIICQKECEIAEGETVESLREKVQTLEKKWYPEVSRWFRDGKIYF